MKRAWPVVVLLLFTFAGPLTSPGTSLAQFPDQRFPSGDPFLNMESQQLTQETLMALRELVNVMKELQSTPQPQKERLQALSERLDFLIMRQQDLAMRQRMSRP
ncbi:MAG TPA: hypothetical protein DDW94_10185 [Deltaproteobacteria bacterium]|nr:MAG: hypothetical protein A2Z79_12780 [Deltaproteobacteria bacterium GWA2_55_82]OIJ73474.1 MAG: hypothetical protein A2V21_303850 [Deltaproteobacteria bacterium GWC2_55_46]HBG47340.1 hypothetical protein [Deltaproteobacteria bacterium]HCY10106.1 hypothetical protein [Deltaproteobacteria bacterium]